MAKTKAKTTKKATKKPTPTSDGRPPIGANPQRRFTSASSRNLSAPRTAKRDAG